MIEIVRQNLQKYQLFPPDTTVLIGVSGGADSLALLHVCCQLTVRMRFRIHVGTLNHLLRGEEGAADVQYVEDMCKLWEVPVTVGHFDVRKLAKDQSLSIEAAARRARYDFLAETALRVGSSRVAVAHHADDQAETVLMRLLRGTGLHGLAGMSMQSPVPYNTDLVLVRPMLNITRRQILAYCAEHGLVAREDSTNNDSDLLRNAVRLKLLPQLAQHNPRVSQALNRVAESAAQDEDFLRLQLHELIGSLDLILTEHSAAFSRTGFHRLHPAMQRRILLWILDQLGISENVHYSHIVDAIELGCRGLNRAVSLLGNDYQLRVEYERLIVERTTSDQFIRESSERAEETIQVIVPGITKFGAKVFESSLNPIVDKPDDVIAVAPDAILTLRNRYSGDRFSPPGLGGHTQKLSRWMVNRKIPLSQRDNVPVLCVNGKIAAIYVNSKWIIGEEFVPNDNSSHLIYFRFLINL
ncbi:MAG: tRNA lysidine(34) synthetase TilS [Anaerolineae bacterium]